MPAYSFKERFVPRVKDGSKKQTIRAKRKHQIKVGDPVYLYYGMRTKHCMKIGEGVCIDVNDILISKHNILIENVGLLRGEELNVFAQKDGFRNWADMKNFWIINNGLPFYGEVIHWKLNK